MPGRQFRWRLRAWAFSTFTGLDSSSGGITLFNSFSLCFLMSGITSNRKRENIGNLLIVLSVAGAFNKPLKSFTFYLWFYATVLDTGHQLIFINRMNVSLRCLRTLAVWDFSVHPLKPTFNSPWVQEPGDLIHDDLIIFQMPGRAREPRKPSLLWSPWLSVLLLLNWILWSPKAVLCVSSLCWCCPRRCTFFVSSLCSSL